MLGILLIFKLKVLLNMNDINLMPKNTVRALTDACQNILELVYVDLSNISL